MSATEIPVVAEVDPKEVKAFFDDVLRRVQGIEKAMAGAGVTAKNSAALFKNEIQMAMRDFNRAQSNLEKFERSLNKPNRDRLAQLDREETAANRLAEEKRKLRARAKSDDDKDARARLAQIEAEERAANKLAEEKRKLRVAERRQSETAAKAEARELDRQETAANRLAEEKRKLRARAKTEDDKAARARLAQIEAEERAANRLAEEKRKLRVAERRQADAAARLRARELDREEAAANRLAEEKRKLRKLDGRFAAADSTVDSRLNVRSGRIAERELAGTLGLGQAKARQAQLEERIVQQIAKAKDLTGAAKVEAERVLKVDEARLAVINARVRSLQKEQDAAVRLAQPKPGMYGPPTPPGFRPPSQPREPGEPRGGGGIFGSTGIAGVFARTAVYGAAAAAIYGTISALRDGIKFTIDYEDALARLSAIAGLTATQMGQLEQTINGVAVNSRFSTLELTEAATVLAQAGFTQQEIASSLQSISQLATASGTTIAEATDVVTGAIGAFQLQAQDAARINDVLASALNNTKLNMQQVALGIQYAGATAFENNINFEELTATIATMANAGIRSGSTIGTGLRQFLVDLQTPTTKLAEKMKELGLSMADIDVKQLGLPEVLNRLAAAGFDSAAAYGTLETRAAAAYLVLRSNREEIQKQIIAQAQGGQAAEAAARGQASLTAEWQRFKNILNASVSDGLQPAVEWLGKLLKGYNDLAADPVLKKLQDQMRVGDPENNIRVLQQMAEYKRVREDLTQTEAQWADAVEKSTSASNKWGDAVESQRTLLSSLDTSMARVFIRQGELSKGGLALQAETATLTSRFAGLASYLDGAAISYGNLTTALHKYRLEQLKLLGQNLQNQEISARLQGDSLQGRTNSEFRTGAQNGLFRSLPQNVQQLLLQARARPFDDNVRQQLLDASRGLGGNQGLFVSRQLAGIQGTVQARRQEREIGLSRDVLGHLATPKGAALQKKVSELPGKPDSVIRGTIAELAREMAGKSPSVRRAYESLILQAQNAIGSGSAPSAPVKPAGSGRGNRAAQRAEREEDRRQAAIARANMRVAELGLDNAVRGVLDEGGGVTESPDGEVTVARRGLTKARLLENLKRADAAFEKWSEVRTAQVEAEIDSQNMGEAEAKALQESLKAELKERRESTNRDIAGKLDDAMKTMVQLVVDVKDRAEQAADQNLAMAESRLAGLDRSALRGQVPGYVRSFAERGLEVARDGRDAAQIGINNRFIAGLQDKQSWWSDFFDKAQAQGSMANMVTARKELDALNLRIQEVTNSNEALKASFQGQVPTGFATNARMFLSDYRDRQGMNGPMFQWGEIFDGLGSGLNSVQSELGGFFSDVINKTETAAQAFQNMKNNILRALGDLAAQLIAKKILQTIINVVGGLFGSPTAASTARLDGAAGDLIKSNPAIFMHGGQVKAYNGRYITDGVPGRDSVNARIAKGEYVVRKSAVDSLGVGFMDQLNERGVGALRAMRPKMVLPPPARQHMNVYVVSPEHKPTMGPNDVLVTIAQDIVSGGQTKQLIKHVSQGG